MGNEVSTQSGSKGIAFKVPAHIAARIKAAGVANIPDKVTTNALTFPGKVWTMTVNGASKVLQRKNEDGDMENVQTVRLVVLDWNPVKERAYYEKAYDGAARQPECWSHDGRKPDISVEHPQSASCETCPMAAKGSRVRDKKETVACAQFRRLAVIPAFDLNFPVLRMKLSTTSEFDGLDEESMNAGWYAWKNYAEHLKANGLDYSGAVITKVRFANTEWPKVQFSIGDFLDDEQLDKVLVRMNSDETKKILAGFTPTAASPKGKSLPQDEQEASGPTQEEVDARIAKAKAEAEAQRVAAVKAEDERLEAEAQRVAAAEAKIRAGFATAAAAWTEDQAKLERIAKVKAELAALEAETAEAGAEVERRRKRRTKAEMEAARAAEAAAKAPAQVAPTAPAADDGGAWDDPVTTKGEVLAASEQVPPTRNVTPKADVVTPSVPIEVEGALAGILGAWGD